MLRVLQVIGAMDRGGAETLIMNLYRVIDRERVQFDFLVHEERECDYDAEILALGGRIFRLPRFTGANYLAYKKAVRAFFDAHPDYSVVHGHIGSCAAIYLAEAKRHGAFTVVHSHAQNYTPGLAGLAFNMMQAPVKKTADFFIGCSMEAGLDRFGQGIVNGPRFAILNNGIDLTAYECDEAACAAAKETFGVAGVPVFGQVGRLSFEKNHEFTFQVFAQVKQQLPDAVLLCAGRGPLDEELKAKAEAMGLGESVRFLGAIGNVPELLKALDVFLFPSIKEGLPLSMVEAQAAGLPCVMSTGVPDLAIVTEGQVRHLNLDEGVDAWADAACDCYAQAQRGRTDSCEQVRAAGFDIRDSAQKLINLYQTHTW